MNHVIIVGRLAQDPVFECTETGKKRTVINVAVPRGYKNSEGRYETDFIRCVLWNGLASATKDFCRVGDIVGIKGRIQNKSYVNADNETKYITEVISERISFISSLNKNDEVVDLQKETNETAEI